MVNSVSGRYSTEELLGRACYRIAWNIRHMWEETGSSDTRLFLEPMIPNKFVLVGRSPNGHYNEHVVPRVVLCRICHQMLSEDSSEDSLQRIAEVIKRHLKIVQITEEEQVRLDQHCHLKDSMPPDWHYETGDTFARLDVAGIEFSFIHTQQGDKHA